MLRKYFMKIINGFYCMYVHESYKVNDIFTIYKNYLKLVTFRLSEYEWYIYPSLFYYSNKIVLFISEVFKQLFDETRSVNDPYVSSVLR